MDPAASGAERRLTRAFLALAVVVPLLFASYTQHRWEDYYITLRHSRNLVEGQGLVYHPGERVHGFTSPLGVLLPAGCLAVTGSDAAALLLFRLLCTAAFAGGGLALLDAAARAGASPRARLLLAALVLVEAKSVSFTISGMETAFMLLFTALGLRDVVLGAAGRALPTGLAWAGLLWTRPDGCVYIAALGLAHLALADRPRREVSGALLRAAAVTTAAYLPWFAFAWSYYGSPVPHTAVAKAAAAPRITGVARAVQALGSVFTAPYGGWAVAAHVASLALALGAAAALALRSANRLARAAALTGGAVLAYLLFAPSFPWYYPPVALCLLVALTGAADLAWRHSRPVVRAAASAAAAVLVAAMLAQLVLLAHQLRVQQREIEDGHRAQLGRWLRRVVRPGERVFLEPLGYIGYFGGVRALDAMGLVSPEVVRLHREGADDAGVIARLEPEWLVLRPVEADAARAVIEGRYDAVRVFDARPRLEAAGWFPGRHWLAFDATFVVFRRR